MMSCTKSCKHYENEAEKQKCLRCGEVQSKNEMEKDTHFPPIINELNCRKCGACFYENGIKTQNSEII